jgi:hypothetical protein
MSISDLIATAALLLSLYNLYIHRRDSLPRLVVRISQGVSENSNGIRAQVVFIEVANPTSMPVIVTDANIVVSRGKVRLGARNVNDDKEQGAHIPPREYAVFQVPVSRIAEELPANSKQGKVSATAQIRDALGNIHKSRQSIVVALSQTLSK